MELTQINQGRLPKARGSAKFWSLIPASNCKCSQISTLQSRFSVFVNSFLKKSSHMGEHLILSPLHTYVSPHDEAEDSLCCKETLENHQWGSTALGQLLAPLLPSPTGLPQAGSFWD